jgi:hypothetical protein
VGLDPFLLIIRTLMLDWVGIGLVDSNPGVGDWSLMKQLVYQLMEDLRGGSWAVSAELEWLLKHLVMS